MSTGRRVARNTLMLLTAQLVSMTFGFLFASYSARYLGANGFGVLSFAVAFTAVYATLSDLGLNTLTTREVARDKRLADKYLGNLVTLKVLLVIVSSSAIVLFVNLLDYPEETVHVVYLVALSSVFSAFSAQVNSLFQAFERMEYQSIGTIVNSSIMLVGTIAAVGLRADVIGFGLIYCLATATVFVYSFLMCIRRITKLRLGIDWRFWKTTLREASPFAIGAISVTIYYYISSVLLSIIRGDVEVGLYSAAYRITILVSGFGGLYHVAIFPALSRLYKQGDFRGVRYVMDYSVRFFAIIGLLAAISLTFFSSDVILIIYGSQFKESGTVLCILTWSLFVIWISSIFGQTLKATDRQRQWSISTVVGALFNFIVNIGMISLFGLIGAAATSLATEVLVFAVVLHFTLPGLKSSLFVSIRRPMLAAVIAVAVGVLLVLAVRLDVNVAGFVTVFTFALLILATKSFTKDDLGLILKSVGLKR